MPGLGRLCKPITGGGILIHSLTRVTPPPPPPREWYNEKGNHSTSIKKKKEIINYYIKQIKIYGNEHVIGKCAMVTRLNIYKTIVLATIYYNVEAWSNISVSEMREIQGIILRKIWEQRKNTPYFGLLAELGIWTIEKQIEYKKLCYYII